MYIKQLGQEEQTHDQLLYIEIPKHKVKDLGPFM